MIEDDLNALAPKPKKRNPIEEAIDKVLNGTYTQANSLQNAYAQQLSMIQNQQQALANSYSQVHLNGQPFGKSAEGDSVVCLLERDDRLGGFVFDFSFKIEGERYRVQQMIVAGYPYKNIGPVLERLTKDVFRKLCESEADPRVSMAEKTKDALLLALRNDRAQNGDRSFMCVCLTDAMTNERKKNALKKLDRIGGRR